MYKNKKAKKYLSILCVVFLLCSLLPTAAFAADAEDTTAQVIDLSKYKSTSYYYNGTIITVDAEKGEDSEGNPIYAKSVIEGTVILRLLPILMKKRKFWRTLCRNITAVV